MPVRGVQTSPRSSRGEVGLLGDAKHRRDCEVSMARCCREFTQNREAPHPNPLSASFARLTP